MAQIHSLNGTIIQHVAKATWQDKPTAATLDGLNSVSRWRKHTWESNVMIHTEWNFIEAFEGQAVTLTTTNYNDRNAAYKTYYNAILTGIAGNPDGPRVTGIRFEFNVRL